MINYFKKYFKNSPTKQAFLQKNLIPFDLGKMIRVGNNKDGGYVVSENGIKSCKFLLSIGLGFHFSFEKDFLKLKKSDSLLIECYDNSVSKKIMREYSTQNLIRLFLESLNSLFISFTLILFTTSPTCAVAFGFTAMPIAGMGRSPWRAEKPTA